MRAEQCNTLKRNGPSGGFAYGMFVNDLIGFPLFDRMYLPTNLLPFVSVTRSSSDVKVNTSPNPLRIANKTVTFCEYILNYLPLLGLDL